jgi:hypothetical protein
MKNRAIVSVLYSIEGGGERGIEGRAIKPIKVTSLAAPGVIKGW